MAAGLESLPRLSEIDVTTPAFQADLGGIGYFLADEGFTDDTAVQKAHRHHEVTDDEAIWEQLSLIAGTLATEVVLREHMSKELEVAWRVTDEGLLSPTAWSPQAPEMGVNATTSEYQARLSRVGTYIAENGLTRIFTLRARQISIPTSPGTRALETTDRSTRTQIIQAVPRGTVSANQASTWWFTPEAGTPMVLNYCEDAEESHNGGETKQERDDRIEREEGEWNPPE